MHITERKERDVTAQAARLEALLTEVEALPDPAIRARVAEIVQGMMALYGEGLARILQIVGQQGSDTDGAKTLSAFAGDPLVSPLLILHDLHPMDIEERVARALESVRPYLQSHGGNVELIGVEAGIARLRLQGHCKGCPSSSLTLKNAIEEAVFQAAPDLIGIEAEGAEETPTPPRAFVPLSSLQGAKTTGPVRSPQK